MIDKVALKQQILAHLAKSQPGTISCFTRNVEKLQYSALEGIEFRKILNSTNLDELDLREMVDDIYRSLEIGIPDFIVQVIVDTLADFSSNDNGDKL